MSDIADWFPNYHNRQRDFLLTGEINLMNEQDWSKEPWSAGCNHTLQDATGELIVPGIDLQDAERIAACVNACAGIPTEELEAVTGAGRQLLESYKKAHLLYTRQTKEKAPKE